MEGKAAMNEQQEQSNRLYGLSEATPCTVCANDGKLVWTHHALGSMGNLPEPRCRNHRPNGLLLTFYRQGIMKAIEYGDHERVAKLLDLYEREAQIEEKCCWEKRITEVFIEDAKHSYSDKQMTQGAIDMAERIAHSMRTD